MAKPSKNTNTIAVIGAIIFLIVLPHFGLNDYWVGLIVKCMVWSLLAMSLDILVGHLGVRSLGHGAFWGFGAYLVVITYVRFGFNIWMAMGSAFLGVILLGMLFAAVTAHIKGVTYLMVSLALAQVLWGLAFQNSAITGGDNGLSGVQRVTFFAGINSMLQFYYFTLLVVVISTALIVLIIRSPLGSIVRSIKQSEVRMSILGYDVWRFKFIIIVISAIFGGIAGILHCQYIQFVSTIDVSTLISAKALLMVLIGGVGTLIGPVIGAFVITLLEAVVSTYTARWSLILGVLFVIAVFCLNHGLYGLFRDIVKKIRHTQGAGYSGVDAPGCEEGEGS